MSDKERDYAEVIRSQGAEFLGIQLGPHGALVLFSDPTSWTTLAVYELEFSPQAVSQRLQKSRQVFALMSHVQKNHSVKDALWAMARNANVKKLIGKEFQCIVARNATVSELGDQSAEDLLKAYR